MVFLVRIAFTAAILCIFLTPSSAQILNVEKSRLDRDTSKFIIAKAGVSLNMFNRSAVVDEPQNYIGFVANGDLAFMFTKHSVVLLNNFNYVSLKREPILNTGYSHLRANFFRQRRESFEAFTQYQYDEVRGLDLRYLIGGGLRSRILQKENFSAYLGNGLMYEIEHWHLPSTGVEVPPVKLLKSTNYLSIRGEVTNNFDINTIHYFQTGYDKGIKQFRNRISGELNLLFKLTSHLAFKSSFTYAYENLPIVPINPFVYSTTNGVQFTW